jgi:Mrp family chromosome partitioning ATPase/capsular polysaccharide biosynthesis protein
MNETTDATAIFAPIWRRKWLILAVGIVVAAGSYFYYKRQRPVFQATTQVFLGAAAEEQAPTEKAGKKSSAALADQASVINTIVVEQVRRRLASENKRKLARGAKVKAKAPEKSEFITITAEGHSAKNIALLANLTARTYITRRNVNHQQVTEKAIAISRRQLRRIEQAALAKLEKPKTTKKKGESGAAAASESAASTSPSASNVIQEANLSSKISQLESTLGTITAQQIKPAKASNAKKLSPMPRKDAIFGFVLGLVLATIAAYALSRFDRRLRSIPAIEALTGLPLLSAMPKVRRPIVLSAGQSPRPSAHLLEPLRRLQAALRLSDTTISATVPQSPPRIILFVSPDPGDGKSTMVADLALAQREAGERVVVVEANFRRPAQNRLLGIEGEGHLSAFLTGRLNIDEATQRVTPAVSAETAQDLGGHGAATAVQAQVGSLFVLGGDRSVSNPPALLAQKAVGDLLRSLADSFDSVLVDVPSPLEVSDAMPLMGIVDQIIVVARIGHTREASAQRLHQLLDAPSCAPVAGVVANFVAPAELKRYGFSRARASIWSGSRAGR